MAAVEVVEVGETRTGDMRKRGVYMCLNVRKCTRSLK